jgi:hypothetical protein
VNDRIFIYIWLVASASANAAKRGADELLIMAVVAGRSGTVE